MPGARATAKRFPRAAAWLDDAAEFLLQFANDCLLLGFAGLDSTPWKTVHARGNNVLRTPNNKQPIRTDDHSHGAAANDGRIFLGRLFLHRHTYKVSTPGHHDRRWLSACDIG